MAKKKATKRKTMKKSGKSASMCSCNCGMTTKDCGCCGKGGMRTCSCC